MAYQRDSTGVRFETNGTRIPPLRQIFRIAPNTNWFRVPQVPGARAPRVGFTRGSLQPRKRIRPNKTLPPLGKSRAVGHPPPQSSHPVRARPPAQPLRRLEEALSQSARSRRLVLFDIFSDFDEFVWGPQGLTPS